jgi:hypothetical protein
MMSRRRVRNSRGGQDASQAVTDAEATTTAAIIEGLRWRLRRPGLVRHPMVLGELRKLEEQVTTQLEQEGHSPGRHRSPAAGVPGQQVGDASGFDLKPDPLTATTPEEYLTALRHYRAWSGDPSWRRMATQAGQAVVHSTMYAAMHGDTLPRFEVVRAIIIGCGGGQDDLKAFATAWRRIVTGKTTHPATDAHFLTAPVPALELAAVAEHV